MLRWLQAFLTATLWGFLLLGLVGLAEGISQWVRFDLPSGPQSGLGPVRLLSPYLVVYGWCGALAAALFYLPASLLARLFARPRPVAITLAVGAALATLAAVYCGYLLREHLLVSWWSEHGLVQGKLLLLVFWLAVLAALFRPLGRLIRSLVQRRTWTLLFPLVIVIVATSLWPNWRQEGRLARTAGLTVAAAKAADRTGAPHFLLVTIDTWRRDHLSLLNPQAPPTPHLNALAADGTVFTRLWSVSPWTLPSMGSLMTGKHPRVLGVRKYTGLPSGIGTLAEQFWQQGYRTVAFATNPYLTSWYGFDRGFEDFEHASVLEPLLPAERSILARETTRYATLHYPVNSAELVIPKAMRWLRRNGEGKPFFLWVHLMNPHLPYLWREVPATGGGLVPGRQPDGRLVPDDGFFAGRLFRGVHLIRNGTFVPDRSEWEALRTLYASEVQYADHWLGQLLQTVQDLGLEDRTVVAVMSDHGEEFFEHDGFEHGHSVMPEVTGIPLILRVPEAASTGRCEDPVSSLGFFPTVCHLLNLPVPAGLPADRFWPPDPDGSRGHSLQIIENLLYEPQQQGILAWPWFRVLTTGQEVATWYDLQADPGATAPVAEPAATAGILAAADSLLGRWDAEAALFRDEAAQGRGPVPTGLEEQLRALGY